MDIRVTGLISKSKINKNDSLLHFSQHILEVIKKPAFDGDVSDDESVFHGLPGGKKEARERGEKKEGGRPENGLVDAKKMTIRVVGGKLKTEEE